MVQGESKVCGRVEMYDNSAKKAGFDAIQQRKKEEEKRKEMEKKKYGGWGPVYKNKEHFASMHIC